MRQRYHILYVPMPLWMAIENKTVTKPYIKPSRLALDLLIKGLEAVENGTKRPPGRPPEPEKKKKTKQNKILYLYNGEENRWYLEENKVQVKLWMNVFSKMGAAAVERAEQYMLHVPGELDTMDPEQLDVVKCMAEEQYHAWKSWIQEQNLSIASEERRKAYDRST